MPHKKVTEVETATIIATVSDVVFKMVAQGHNVPMRIKLTGMQATDKMIERHALLQSVQEKIHVLQAAMLSKKIIEEEIATIIAAVSDAVFVLIAQGHNVPMRIKLTGIRVTDKMIGHHALLQSVQEKIHVLLITPIDVVQMRGEIARRQEHLQSLSKVLEEKNAVPMQVLTIEIAHLALVSAIP